MGFPPELGPLTVVRDHGANVVRRGVSLVRTYRDDLRAGLIVFTAVLLLGIPFGFLWEAVTPKVPVVARAEGVFYAEPEGNAFIAADGWFAVIAAAIGVCCAFVAFVRYRRYGVATVLGLAVGGVLASVLAWQLGHALGPADVADGARTAKDGVPFSGPLELRAYGVLLVWSLASTTVFLAFTAGNDAEDRDAEDRPAVLPAPIGADLARVRRISSPGASSTSSHRRPADT
jgi:hypothetical protein